MSVDFTNVGEFHQGKGNKKSRLGPRTSIRTGGVKQSPNDIAMGKLKSILVKKNLLNEDMYEYLHLIRNSDQIRFMNMGVLAEVLSYITLNPDISQLSYNSISENIEALIPKEEKLVPEELEIIRLRMAATFLRYLIFVEDIGSKEMS